MLALILNALRGVRKSAFGNDFAANGKKTRSSLNNRFSFKFI